MIPHSKGDTFDQRRIQRWKNAAEHFSESIEEHKTLEDSIQKESIEKAHLSSKVQEDRLNARKAYIQNGDPLGYERVLGLSDLLPINYLQRGLDKAKSVCRIHIFQPNGRHDGYGTGFLITNSLLLTNNHVLSSPQAALRSFAEFDFQLDSDFIPISSHYFQLKPDRFFYTSEKLDFTIVSVEPQSRNGQALSSFGYLQLKETSGKALPTESVTIIQHPSGGAKSIALRSNEVIGRKGDFIHYRTDTLPGSSGAPVLSDDWEVVALHHSGVPKRNSKGKILRRDGRIWQPGDSDDEINWIANEGVRISSIFEHLKKQTHWNTEDLVALDELGTRSRTNLNEALQSLARPRVVNHADDSKRSLETAPPRITLSELQEKLSHPEISEAEISPYFVLDPFNARGLDPVFRLHEDLVQIDQPELRESALVLNSANWICKRSRQRSYRKKIKEAPDSIKIISEGDSWFQYPFRLHDVVDHLMAQPDLAILSFGEAGDLIRDIVARAEFLPSIAKEDPSIFLISGGGNDLVAHGGLKRFVFEPHNSFDPHLLIKRPELERFKFNLASDYNNLFRIVLGAKPDIDIICHGYSYAIPNNGPWLGQPLNELGITDHEVQAELLRIIMDEINQAIAETAESFPQQVHYLDLRNTVPPHGWFDELHPQNPYYGNVANVFLETIKQLQNS